MPDIPIESILLLPVLPDFPAKAITRFEPHTAEQDYQEGDKSIHPALHAYPQKKKKATAPVLPKENVRCSRLLASPAAFP